MQGVIPPVPMHARHANNSTRANRMNDRFKIEAWVMVLIPTAMLLIEFIVAVIVSRLHHG